MENENILSDKSVGEYVKYNNYTWRIQSKTEDTIKLILDGYIEKNDAAITEKYTNVINYLNKTFYNTLSKNNLKKCDFYKGTYNKNTMYDYQNIYTEKANNYVGLSSIGELFINDYNNSWLYNSFGSNSLQYKTTEQNRIIADVNSNKNNITPVICLKKDMTITAGEGTKDNPYIVEE